MKKDRQTQNAMRDRYNWLKGLAKLRNYNFNGRENDYLFVLYSTMRSIFSPERSNVLLSLNNGGLAYPRSDDAIAKIIEHTKNRDRPCKYHNEDIVSKLKITEQEIATLQIGHNKKVVEERKLRANQKQSVQTWVEAYYSMGYTTAEIAKALPSVSKRTIQRYLAKIRKEQALENAEETASIAAKIIDMYRNNVDIVQIARQTKSTVDDVRRILGLGGMTDFIKQEIKCTKNELQGFKSPDCLELFSLTSYNEERTLTGLDEHTTAMAILQTFTGNICITGAGGTGKTFLLNHFLESLTKEEKASTLIVCPTGKAADHLNGITIHKAFHLSNDVQLPDAITTVPKDLLSVTRIIIDEVNMVRIDIFDKIMRMVQFIEEKVKHKIQVIVMGDWGQIQPVATDTDKMLLKEFYPNAKGLYAFQSTMWEKMNFRKITLTKIYRQDNLELVEKLHAIKYGNLDAVKWFNDNASTFFMTDGVIEPDYQERGAHDYRKDACLTLREFEQIVLHCIVYYNSFRVVDFPFTEEMLADGVKPNASSIFAWGKKQMGANFISVAPQKLIQTLLPRATGTFTRKGLRVHGLRYKHDEYTEAFLSGGEVIVAYNPEDVTEVWLLDNGQYVPFMLIESRFNGKSLDAVQTMQKARKQTVNAATANNLQAQIDLAEHIQVIASKGKQTDVGIKNIRNTRKREQARTHIDFVKEGTNCG